MDAYPFDQPVPLPASEIADAWRRTLPGVPTDSIMLITPLWRAAKLLADNRRRFLAEIGMEAATLDLLSTLRRSGGTLSTRELAEQCLVSAGAISQRVARAEDDGLVTRRNAGARHRQTLVSLTVEGTALIDRTVTALLEHEEALVKDVAGRDELATLVGGLLAHLSRRGPEPRRP
ncbi:MarR family transcriptional regulator [Actinorhabdospora filicis]|uniref:MarR family transcriptional regulator n=1 Tax=Actinorhabdospora filicis TaxID=1785913 RepID=A0A9W6SJR3_9ACTN|nr:MarR family transcriptional regulator [Actinorhabdospora filicis]GLZ77263.1 MarR family transcriptional regulator [Actinorhabdospora filicis]